jgi:PAS domain S-box-containing protein
MRPLRVLSLEDDLKDTELIQELLAAEELVCEITRVETKEGFAAAINAGEIDLILADYSLPSYDGISALQFALEHCPDIPFLFVSGTLGEEVAIEALKIGATDYILKTRLSRLAPSVGRALRESRERAERKRAQDALRRSEAYLAEAQKLSRTGSFGWDVMQGRIYWSEETFRIFEYDPGIEVTLDRVMERTHPDDRYAVQQFVDRVSAERKEFDYEHRLLMPDGSVKHVRIVGRPSETKSGSFEFVGAVTDITKHKQAEEILRRSEDHFRLLVDATPALIYTARSDGYIDFLNQGWLNYLGLPLEEVCGWQWTRVFHPDDVEKCLGTWRAALASGEPAMCEGRVRRADGEYRTMLHRKVPLHDQNGNVVKWYGASADIEDLRRGQDELQKALDEIETLKDRLYQENIALKEEIDKTSMFEEIVGESAALRAVLARVAKVAPTDSTVLITGETGTGKELVARAIHKRSSRGARAFVSVNCAAIPASLIASELFGHEKGAFTGAIERRLGRFELADGGTIFLDEIGELPMETQIALLRVLQEREFERVGGTKPIHTNVRVIAATNRDLQDSREGGAFRSDLFYRLNVFPIEVPPLRERREDIPLLVEYFINRYATKAGKKFRGINRATLERLRSYAWPGNIRELQNVIERSTIVCETEFFTVDESWLSHTPEKREAASRALLRMQPSEEKRTIEEALAEAKGRVAGPSGAAARLGLPPSTLDSKIRALRINKHRFKTV